MTTGHIPVFLVEGTNIAEAWEKSLVQVYNHGCDVKTEYDKPNDPPSKDCSMTLVISDPLAEPMIHMDFPGGLEDLQEYVMEVLDGIKDHRVRNAEQDPNDTRWEYTYHQRLFDYSIPGVENIYNQIEMIVDKLVEAPYSRRAQAITWKVWEDPFCYDPACLQSIWCRLLPDAENALVLNTNVRFRSNDAYKAAFMNIFALVKLQEKIAQNISARLNRPVKVGRYVHHADSYHIYGSYFYEFKERFIDALKSRSFDQRTMHYSLVKEMMEEAKPQILKKAKSMGR